MLDCFRDSREKGGRGGNANNQTRDLHGDTEGSQTRERGAIFNNPTRHPMGRGVHKQLDILGNFNNPIRNPNWDKKGSQIRHEEPILANT